MINDLISIFDSLTKSLDILYVIEEIKPVSRIMADSKQLEIYRNFLKNNNLFFEISDFKIKKETDENLFSNKGTILDNNEKEGSNFIYISKSKEKAELAKKAEHENNHKELGKLLGYPKCCIDFFEKNSPIESKKKNDYTLSCLKNSNGFVFPFYNNIAVRHLDINLLSHFPCNFNCHESLKIAKRNLFVIEKYSNYYRKIIETMLKGAVIYTEDNGIFLLSDYKVDNDVIYYDKVLTEINNEQSNQLKISKSLQIINKNKIIINNKKFENLGLMIFI